jgi:hypothetical protein
MPPGRRRRQPCRSIEIELREMLGEAELPPALQPKSNIAL